MTTFEKLSEISQRFAGFSLERRSEWWPSLWRIKILPNKTTRQDYKITVFGESLEDVVGKAYDVLSRIDAMSNVKVDTRMRYTASGDDLSAVLENIRQQKKQDENKS